MATPLQKKLIALAQNSSGIPVSTAAAKLSISTNDVERAVTRLNGQLVIVDNRLYTAGSEPRVTLPAQAGYIILDTETTGVDPETADLLEIAAIKVTRTSEVQFQRYVAFDGQIPADVERLTGITPQHLKAHGTGLKSALSQFLEFAGDLPWVGHNLISYDHPLLSRLIAEEGLQLPRVKLYDTLHLTHAAMWDDPPPSFRLDHLADAFLGGRPKHAHSAIVDVDTTRKLIRFCEERLNALPPDELNLLRVTVPELEITHPHDSALGPEASKVIQRFAKPFLEKVGRVPLVWNDGNSFAAPTQLLEDPRPGQLEMASGVATTLVDGGIRAVEAPTGTGKTRAYLAAAIVASSSGKVTLSTHTKQLQDQVIQEANVFAKAGARVRVVTMKGNSNYICPDRLERSLTSLASGAVEQLSEDLRTAAHIILGAASGEFDALPSGPSTRGPAMGRMRRASEVHSERCGEHCTYFNTCAFQNMQRAANGADVIVTNHALAFTKMGLAATEDTELRDSKSGDSSMDATQPGQPEPKRIIFDEAHDLADAAVAAYTIETSTQDLLALSDELSHQHTDEGLLRAIDAHYGPMGRSDITALTKRTRDTNKGVQYCIARFKEAGWRLLRERGQGDRAFGLALRVVPSAKQTRHWVAMYQASTELTEALYSLRSVLSDLTNAIGFSERLGAEAMGLYRRVKEASDALSAVRKGDDEGRVYALQGQEHDVRWWSKPLFIGDLLREAWHDFDSVVLTSATLRVPGSGVARGSGDTEGFGHLEQTLGLPAASYQVLPPVLPFELAYVLLATHLPITTHPAFPDRLARELNALLPQLDDRTLGLFTANTRLDAVSVELDQLGLEHLNSRRDGAEQSIERLRAANNHLLGTAGLMQGLDVRGLKLVHLDKTPFPIPDLLLQAQQDALGFDTWWREQYLPKAVLRFVQTFGRLIRETDRGVGTGAFVLWDRRLAVKAYAEDFLRALPATFRREHILPSFSREQFYENLAKALGQELELHDVRSAKELLLDELRDRLCNTSDLRALLNEAVSSLFEIEGELTDDQFNVIAAVLQGRDVFPIMPTGSGKSLTFQLPALLQEGYTLVISPLVALIQDQVQKLQLLGLPAAGLWGGMPRTEQQEAIDAAGAGQLKLLYVAPERVRRSAELRYLLKSVPPTRIVLDEAHCLSHWGFDFRPDYLKVAPELQELGVSAPVSALTATATAKDREEIEARLRMRNPLRLVRSFERPNLYFATEGSLTRTKRELRLVEIIKSVKELHSQEPHRIVVYAGTRKDVERLAALLSAYFGESILPYHAGLSPFIREETLEAFLNRETSVIVATNAFGMGVDVPDIRAVIHYSPPMSIEAYVQEAGRAGRDKKDAFAVALWGKDSTSLGQFLIKHSYPSKDDAARLLTFAQDLVFPTARQLAEEANVDPGQVSTLLHLLEEAGNLKYSYRPGLARVFRYPWSPAHFESWVEELLRESELVNLAAIFSDDLDEKVDQLFRMSSERVLGVMFVEPVLSMKVLRTDLTAYNRNVLELRGVKERKLADMTRLLKGQSCRRISIGAYFNERHVPCGNCDRCATRPLPWSNTNGTSDVDLASAWDVKKEILTLVARLEQRNRPHGRSRIMKVLLGDQFSHREEGKAVMLSDFLIGQPSFGRLAFVPKKTIDKNFDELQAEQLLQVTKKDQYDLITLTERGKGKVAKWIRN